MVRVHIYRRPEDPEVQLVKSRAKRNESYLEPFTGALIPFRPVTKVGDGSEKNFPFIFGKLKKNLHFL
jgi:hypothetical protein